MAEITTSKLSDSLRAAYISDYFQGVMAVRVYDQIASPIDGISMEEAFRSSSVVVPYISGMMPATSAISETGDITPQTLEDATASITTISRGSGITWSEKFELQTYTNFLAEKFRIVGENMMESVELLASNVATQGSFVMRATGRSSLDAGTSAHRASDSLFNFAYATLLTLRVPGFVNARGEANTWSAIMHPYVFNDIRESGNVDSIGLYQDEGIHLNFELGKIGPFRLVVTPYAKVFWGAGAANATNVATTLASDATRLSKTIVTNDDVSSSITAGTLWMIGTKETGNTHYPTNEPFRVVSADGTTLTIMGTGPNDGLRYDHFAGETITNADSVFTIVFAGPKSLIKIWSPDIGEYGTVVGPEPYGLLKQHTFLGWKYYGGYGKLCEKYLLRYEVSVSAQA